MGVVNLFKAFVIAGWATFSAVSFAQAQSLAGPAELPPANYKGTQFVDSRGCVFLRAGIGGRVNWVPRISRDRKALCGQPPAAAARELATVQAPIAPEVAAPKPVAARAVAAKAVAPVAVARVAPAPKRSSGYVGKPMETIASQHYVTKPVAPVALPKANQAVRNSKCPATAPFGALVTRADGRRALLCSSDAGFDVAAAKSRMQAERAAPQQMAASSGSGYTPKASYLPEKNYYGRGYACPPSLPVARRFNLPEGGTTVRCTALNDVSHSQTGVMTGVAQAPKVPKGYRAAWDDDRLNPNRGLGTVAGQAQQDKVWTRDVPANSVAKTAGRKVHTAVGSNAPRRTKGMAGQYYVQVGTFGEAANASRSAARLQGLGLPVAQSRINSKGRQLQIVMAGPFADAGVANAALSAARQSGFGDAFIR
jgi:hypothetical protein